MFVEHDFAIDKDQPILEDTKFERKPPLHVTINVKEELNEDCLNHLKKY